MVEKTQEEFTKELVIKREIFIPRTPQAHEIKSFIYFDRDGKERSLLTRVIENNRNNACLPTLVGFDSLKPPTFADTYNAAWKILKDRGFPVVSDVWKMSEDKVATTNLIEYGGSVYDRKIDAIIEREPLPMDKEFLKVPMGLVQKETDKLVSLAEKTGVGLMTDDPFHIVIRPDGSWYVLVLDIGKVWIYSSQKDFKKNYTYKNQYFVDRGLNSFARIQQNIKTLRDARGLT